MNISATISSHENEHCATVSTNGVQQQISIAPKPSGFGSSANGGELLLLAIATCFCNDIYREAARRNIAVTHMEVEVTGTFGAEGEPGTNFRYRANVQSDSTPAEVQELISYVDKIAEIHNTLRAGASVTLV